MLTEYLYYLRAQFQRTGNGVMQLTLLNGLIFVGLLLLKIGFLLAGYAEVYQAWWYDLTLPAAWDSYLQQPWSLLTYFWIHDNFFEIIWHLLFLYSFGQLLLYKLRSRHLIILYLLGGIGGGLCFLLLYKVAPGFQGVQARLVGAATSLYAVMAGAATLSPHFYFHLLLIGRIPVKYIVGALLLFSCFELSQHQVVGVANLSGALIGYVYVRWLPVVWKARDALVRFKSIPKTKGLQVTYSKSKNHNTKPANKTAQQAIIDQVLDKVAKSGYENLTKEEKRQLFEAGQ